MGCRDFRPIEYSLPFVISRIQYSSFASIYTSRWETVLGNLFRRYLLRSIETDDLYLLVVKEDIRRNCWWEPGIHATTDHKLKLLSSSVQNVFPPEFEVSDQGSHVLNDVIKTLDAPYRVKHQQSVEYFPWTNGAV